MKCCATLPLSFLLVVSFCSLLGTGCSNGTTSSDTVDPLANTGDSVDATTASKTPSHDAVKAGEGEAQDAEVVVNPQTAVIQALEEVGATVKTTESGHAVAVEMPRQVDAHAWEQLQRLTELEELDLSWTHVRDLSAIADLASLKRLDISWAKYVNDAHIDDLVKAGQLELLVVEGNDFTEAGLQRLREGLGTTVVRINSDVALSGLPVPEQEKPAAPAVKPEGKYDVGDMAPEIQGKDAAGKEFKLSDYRGQVVMLDFYGNWCPPCRAMYPHNRELMEKYQDQDFVLLGINSDPELGTLVRSTEDGKVTWRSWWDGNGGPIASEWQIPFWPSIFVIDQEGIIRYKRSSTDTMDEIAVGITGTIDRLLGQETLPTPEESAGAEGGPAQPQANQSSQEAEDANPAQAEAEGRSNEGAAGETVKQEALPDSE